jgi:hypothetical protein
MEYGDYMEYCRVKITIRPDFMDVGSWGKWYCVVLWGVMGLRGLMDGHLWDIWYCSVLCGIDGVYLW